MRSFQDGTDEQIVNGLKRGDDHSYELTYQRYGRKIIAVAMNKSGLSFEDAQELCNDVILEIAKKIDGYDPKKGKFGTWILTIAHRRAIDFFRKHGRKDCEYSLADWDTLAKATPSTDTHELPHALHEEAEMVADALSQLSNADQDLLRMHAQSIETKEIADWLGKTTGATATAITRARKRFHSAFVALKRSQGSVGSTMGDRHGQS